MAKDTKENNQLVKAKSSSLQKRDSNIVSRGLSDLGLLDGDRKGVIDEEDGFKIYGKVHEFYKNGQYDRAIEDFNKAIQLGVNHANVYRRRGNAYYRKGQDDRAIEDYNKAISLDPNFAAAYNCRGVAYYNKGQYNRAIEDFNKAIVLDPNYACAYCNRGRAYYRKGQHDKVVEDFNKAIALDPSFVSAVNNRDLAYEIKGNVLDERFYVIKNEKTGEVLTVDKNDIRDLEFTPVK